MKPDAEPAPRLFLGGPTGAGKSAVALGLAERLGGEILTVDSMQVYRGLDLGTAKPSPADQRRVPHHLLDVVSLRETFDAARFVTLASEAVRLIEERGRLPIFCGGTGLCFRAWLEGLGAGPASDPALRAELERTPLPALLHELSQRDPAAWAQIDRQNRRRVVRAVEVLRLTGQPLGALRAPWSKSPTPAGASLQFCYALNRATEDLRDRLERRVDEMFARGLVAETKRLLSAGLSENPSAMQAIGYRQVVEHLRGERGLMETVALVKQRTWQLAKRQRTWFRHQGAWRWLELGAGEPPEAAADLIAAEYRRARQDLRRGCGPG